MRPLDQPPVEVRGQELREVVHVFAQQRSAPESEPGGVSGEHVAGIDRDQIGVPGVDRHVRHDADAEPQPHVGLNHVGIAVPSIAADSAAYANTWSSNPRLGFAVHPRVMTSDMTAAPEIDPAGAMAGLTLLAGGLAVLRGRRSKK